ncbi:MFS general substrate transporter [Myriangium duriaei CBS 260.36]|uniref:MFS general substrate transporter n=1 Tax=Myriangium duriaei CBS 260.36 TaxID=1168546 RepID=A0A9P4MJI2_9PEZI|nr:MFS general substrate transporter [Myriangium duriaei CBS 260.36]
MESGIGSMTSRSVTVFAVTVICFTLASIFVFFRMVSRAWIVKRISLDDYVMLLAWVLAFGVTFTICYGATVGLGRHEADVPDSWQGSLKSSQYAFSLLYQPALMAEKSSILIFFLTLSQSNKIFKWATMATLAVVLCAGFAITMFTAFQCRPPSAAYDLTPSADSHCTNIVTIYLSSSPVNIITDLALLILPMPILTGMRLPRKQKIILIVTFSFGLFVAVVDVIRVAYLQSASTYRLSKVNNGAKGDSADASNDFSWYASYSFMWTTIEVNIGIMCACVPGLKPLVARFAPHLILSETSGSKQEVPSVNNTAEMIEQQRLPSLPNHDVQSRDFAIQLPPAARGASVGSASTRPAPEMSMLQFLSTPDMDEPRSPGPYSNLRSHSIMTNASTTTRPGSPGFFDFVNMQGNKSLVQMTNRESIFPISMVTILFFIWGFEYGLLDTLNKQFQTVSHISSGQSVALHSAYYAGYFVGPLTVGRLVLKKWGFKACYNVGLATYACGTLIFWVAAVLTSFPTDVVVNFIVGVGLSILETGANPFISLCGPPEYAEIRLNLSQGFQAIGTIIAPLIAEKAFTKYTNNAPSLINTQWAYLGIAFFTCMLAFAYYYVPLPEATDAELEDAAERLDHANYAKVGGTRVIWYILGLGVLSQFCYVGAQEVYGTTFTAYMAKVRPEFDVTNYMAIAHTAFAVSRFTAAGLGFFIKPRYLLLFFFIGSVVFSGLTTSFTGDTAVALLIMVFFFEGPLFSLIYASCLRGLGKHTKDGTALLTAAISGGAVFPAISYAASTQLGAQPSLVVGVAAFAGGALLPVLVSTMPSFRRVLDPFPRNGDGHQNDHNRQDTPSSPSNMIKGLGISAFGFHHKKERAHSKDGSTDYRERFGSAATITPDQEDHERQQKEGKPSP